MAMKAEHEGKNLQHSSEKLQSVNDELLPQAELKATFASIPTAHNDLLNLSTATEIGILFLDAELRIRMFTPPVAELFDIRESDVGRTLTSFTHQLLNEDIERDARRVLSELVPHEGIVESKAGRSFMLRIRPYRTADDRIEGLVTTFIDVTARRHAEQKLRESEERYRRLFNSMDEGFCIVHLVEDESKPFDFQIEEINAAFERQTGLQNAPGKTMRALMPLCEQFWFDNLLAVARSGKAARFEAPATELNRYYEVFAFPVEASEGVKLGVLFRDISERKRAESHLELMVQELNHRVKNTLAVVQAIAQQTFKHEDNSQTTRRTFEGRLAALAAAHNLLTESHWEKASLDDVIHAVVTTCSHSNERLDVSGPHVDLQARQTVSLTMALHELCSNATKYGALSNDSGRVEISWHVSQDLSPRLTLHWVERGGPHVTTPEKKGFGSMMVERALAHELEGSAKLAFTSTGVHCTIVCPLASEGESEEC